MDELSHWDSDFEKALRDIPTDQKGKAGVLLPLVPLHADWDDFLKIIPHNWEHWRKDLLKCSYCLLILYDGLAFYEYKDNTFWPQFAKSLGLERITANLQTEINSAFSKISEMLGLYLKPQDYNGSAVFHIGIPLSLWEGFLDICEWAIWNEWENLTEKGWEDNVIKRVLGRPRLAIFLRNNREAACRIIKEMLDARQILTEDPSLTIDFFKDAFLFCGRYIDEVHETAEFLRPNNPESLLRDRAQIVWDKQRNWITLHLPPVSQNKLPAKWQIGDITQPASSSADEIVLNAQAFKPSLNLQLKSEQHIEEQRIFGVSPWGLFDLDNGGFLINPSRSELPLRNYALISKNRIEDIRRKGFDEEENQINEEYELADGTTCYLTNLWPTGKYKFAELKINDFKIDFRSRAKIEARFFVGENNRAANFAITQGKIKTDVLPILCVSIPCGYFQNNLEELRNKFKVSIDSDRAGGQWEKRTTHQDDDREFYFWKWSHRPLIKQIKSGTLKDLKDLDECFKSPDLKGDRIFSIEAPNIKKEYKVYLAHSKYEMRDCWKNLPGTFLPWFLLCQNLEGMKWDDLLLARDIITPNLHLKYHMLRKYEEYGLLKLRGRKWIIKESRAVLGSLKSDDNFQLNYCGDPSLLWGLYRRMSHDIKSSIEDDYLPLIEVIDKRGKPPYLQMLWKIIYRKAIEEDLKKKGIRVCSDLWNP